MRNTDYQCHHFLSLLWDIINQDWFTRQKIMGIQGLANWMGPVDPLCRSVISQTRIILRLIRSEPLNRKLILDNRMESVMARWFYLPNNIVPLDLPEPSNTDGCLPEGIRLHDQLISLPMTKFSINILELLAIWMTTLMIQQKKIVITKS